MLKKFVSLFTFYATTTTPTPSNQNHLEEIINECDDVDERDDVTEVTSTT
jgi:hypothetical protein